MKTVVPLNSKKLPETFEALSALHPLQPIRDKVDFENAQELADTLAIRNSRTVVQDEYLESLSLLMEHFENEHSPVQTGNFTAIELLKYLMSSHQMSASDLGRLLGERSMGSEVLTGRRQISKAHIRTLAAHFRVRGDLLL